MTNVAFVCQWYPPEPVEIPESISTSLRGEGLELEVLTGIPNYPAGDVLDGYKAWQFSREVINGIKVRRTPLYASHDANAVKRIVNYISWAVSSCLGGQAVLRNADVALVYSSPATAASAPMIARRLWGTPYVLMIQDLWPDTVLASGFLPGFLGKVAHRILTSFVNASYRWASRIVVISPGMKDLLVERGVPNDKIELVYNWLPQLPETQNENDDHGADADASSLHTKFGIPNDHRVFLYAGNHGSAQALRALVEAFTDDRTVGAHLVMVGEGVEKQELIAKANGASRIHFHDLVSRKTAATWLEASDVNVVSLADRPLFAVTMPSKVQSGLAAGQPMLVISNGDVANVVTENGAGISAKPEDRESVIEAVQVFLNLSDKEFETMGARGKQTYENSMSAELGVPKLTAILEAAAKDH